MSIINISEQIIPMEKIINKNINDLTFKEIISLVFHAMQFVIKDESMNDQDVWKNIYTEFERELIEQNKKKWPYMTITKNDYAKRIDIYSIDASFISSNNIFMLLLRLLYIENYKRPYVYKSYKYHKILGYKIKADSNDSVTKLSLNDIFDFLHSCMKYYIKIYNDGKHSEFELGKKIIGQLI